MFAKMLARTVQASFHRGDAGRKNLRHLGVTAPLLYERKERAVLGTKLSQGMAQRVEFLGIHRSVGFRDIFVLFAERQKHSPQFLTSQLIDTGIPGETEKPRLELRGRLQPIQRANHFDENLLREVFDIIAPTRHSVNKAGHPMLVGDNEIVLGRFLPLLSPAYQLGQRVW